MIMVRALPLLLGLVVGLASSAAAEAPPLAPGQVDVEASRILVHVGGVRLGHEHAIEGRVREGALRLGAASDAGKLVFEMSSFVADSDRARQELGLSGTMSQATQESVTRTMLGERVLDAMRFPTATYTIDSATKLEKASPRGLVQYRLAGTLEWHGVKRPLTFVVEVDTSQDRWRVRGKFPLVQTDFGIKPYSAAFGAVAVADELTVHGDVHIESSAK
jgi:polyisoprenoid-binding protein YceI